ncbi:MAG: c-type cytochrome [Nitrospinae bacterium]|nr:c-type cytochrome [Nitrospinota bacterium]
MKKTVVITALLALVLASSQAFAADGAALVKSNKCDSCHKMTGPAVKTLKEIEARKAPDLFYAGSKFNKDWLVKFLQNPSQIRPAGTVYTNFLKKGEQDTVAEPPKCASKLDAGGAAAVADYLMTLKDASMKTGVAKLGEFSKAKAKMLIIKTEACNGCHRIEGNGGVSCPTFEGIGARLNPDFVYNFVQHPQQFDPKIWMAKRELAENDLQLIVNYIASLK